MIVEDLKHLRCSASVSTKRWQTHWRVDLPQMVKLARTNQLVCHFRTDDHQTITV
ncbi:flagellar transcriptional regulator FlhD [Salmonella enterica subsp. enterica]|nr:flagellar transcriptional regulator FlhD [Salmonella enterica subsp. enterica]